MRLLATTLLAVALGGCNIVYTIDIQQGNYVTEDLVAKLRIGMTKAEVRQLLGTPLLIDTFHQNRWDYYFSNMKGGKPDTPASRLSIFFENEKVKSFAGGTRPAALAPVGTATPPQPTIK